MLRLNGNGVVANILRGIIVLDLPRIILDLENWNFYSREDAIDANILAVDTLAGVITLLEDLDSTELPAVRELLEKHKVVL
jgi:hypothetical protein